jgi:hypothetical protein
MPDRDDIEGEGASGEARDKAEDAFDGVKEEVDERI